jgi:hypothetical protein
MTSDLGAPFHEHNAELVGLFRVPPPPRIKSPDAPPPASAVPVERGGGTSSVPVAGCRNCRGHEFILLEDAPDWLCARCHPPPAGAVIVARWTDRQPVKTAAMFDTREVDDVG